jgi:hypothetical protein
MGDRQKPQTPWKGDEVEDAPDGAAEDAADRAAGRERVRADADILRPAESLDGERVAPRPMSAEDDRENQEEKREAAAEDHAQDRENGTGTAPKNL